MYCIAIFKYECTSFINKYKQLISRSNTLFSFASTFVVAWEGELPCRKWDCECAFKRQRGCCCAAPEIQEVEDQIFKRVMDLSKEVSQLSESILEVIGKIICVLLSLLFTKRICLPYSINIVT